MDKECWWSEARHQPISDVLTGIWAVLSKQIRHADHQIVINSYRDFIVKTILSCFFIVFKVINTDRAKPGIDCPIFPCGNLRKIRLTVRNRGCYYKYNWVSESVSKQELEIY